MDEGKTSFSQGETEIHDQGSAIVDAFLGYLADDQLEEEYQPSEISEQTVPKEAPVASAQGATVNDDASLSASSVETALAGVGKYV